MQQQIVLQTARKVDLSQQTRDEFDLFAGISSPINSPFNLFLRLNDLRQEGSSLIYYYAYSLGKSRAIIWGVYNEATKEFLIDSACQYDLQILNLAMAKWKDNKYQIISSETKNNKGRLINLYLIFDKMKDLAVKNYEKFRVWYMYNALLKKRLTLDQISEEALKMEVSRLIDDFKINPDREFLDEFDDLLIAIQKYNSLITKASNDDAVIKFYGGLIKELKETKSLNYMKLFLFILTMINVEEYRIAKYIITENNERLKGYIDGSFLGLWLQDVSVTLAGELKKDPKEILKMLCEKIVELLEPKINTTDIVVELSRPVVNKLEVISREFLHFLEKSTYSKESYVKQLPACYSPVECKGEECGLYEHGDGIVSKYDFT
jgi:hypothetical protein